jgi:hypothetical protein
MAQSPGRAVDFRRDCQRERARHHEPNRTPEFGNGLTIQLGAVFLENAAARVGL